MRKLFCFAILFISISTTAQTYQPNWESLDKRPTPQWFKDSKFGIFIHINPVKQTKNAVDSPEFFELLSKYKNVKAVFNGHDHDEENIKMKNDIPFIFDAHFGGNWGTAYRGFRVVEVMKDDSIHTYIMNPAQKLNEEQWDRQLHNTY